MPRCDKAASGHMDQEKGQEKVRKRAPKEDKIGNSQ